MDELKNVWSVFQNLDEFVYASDIETNELVYLNRKAMDTFGLKSIDEIKGRKCYEVLQGSNLPCALCTNNQLSVGNYVEWSYYNRAFDRHLMVKDTMVEEPETGKKYHIGISIDITGLATKEMAQNDILKIHQKMEMQVNEGMKEAISAETPDESIDIILEHMGKSLCGERTYIFEQNQNGGDDNTYEWCAPGVHPEKENLQNLPPEVCAKWYRCFEDGKDIMIQDLEEIKESDPLQYENLKRQGIRSLVVVPLYDNGKVIGFYGVDNPPPVFLEYSHDILQIAAVFLLSCLKRRKLLAKLMELSYKDALTGIGNRFAMTNYIRQMDRKQSVAVVYCDVTGLKQVNDTQGHEAGDTLIRNACESLKQVFDGYGLFRIGGDELMVICPNITHAIADNRVAQLKETIKDYSVNLAVGMVWLEEMGVSLERTVMEAEKRMYEDKAEYYRTSGIERRECVNKSL